MFDRIVFRLSNLLRTHPSASAKRQPSFTEMCGCRYKTSLKAKLEARLFPISLKVLLFRSHLFFSPDPPTIIATQKLDIDLTLGLKVFGDLLFSHSDSYVCRHMTCTKQKDQE
jgi:hypothetical protein